MLGSHISSQMIDQIKNIRLTNQSFTPIFRASGKSGGQFGWLRVRSEATLDRLALPTEPMETIMTAITERKQKRAAD